ncbi:MAG: hypothetical protein Harvfovirus79_3 [Harvfovirus sp.]|uniref:Uncharacterized protein n=1 Tax=Harvfovirus sp. TaxID=2487768 RepID=A0A3G5A606_9VIRU|nr:MAG: hypothetical protein Harvfovirus79_3 [Harvfovirus sp.]
MLQRLFRSYESSQLSEKEETYFDETVAVPTKKYFVHRRTLIFALLIANASLLIPTLILLTFTSIKNLQGLEVSFLLFDIVIVIALYITNRSWNKFKYSSKCTRFIGAIYLFGLLFYVYLPYALFGGLKSMFTLLLMITPAFLLLHGVISTSQTLQKIFPSIYEFKIIHTIAKIIYLPIYTILFGILTQHSSTYTALIISFTIFYTIHLLKSNHVTNLILLIITIILTEQLFQLNALRLFIVTFAKYTTLNLSISDYLLHLIIIKPGTFTRPLNDDLDTSTEIIADIKREYIVGYPLDEMIL